MIKAFPTVYIRQTGTVFWVYPDEPSRSELGRPALRIQAPEQMDYLQARRWFAATHMWLSSGIAWVE